MSDTGQAGAEQASTGPRGASAHHDTDTGQAEPRPDDTAPGDPGEARAVPFYCPYCGEEDLRPHEQHGSWWCTSCARAFSLKLRGIGVRGVQP